MLVFIQTKKKQYLFWRGTSRDYRDAIIDIRNHYTRKSRNIYQTAYFLDAVEKAWNPYSDYIRDRLRELAENGK